MSIIQQLAEIESKALKYKQQDTVYIYTQRPRACKAALAKAKRSNGSW